MNWKKIIKTVLVLLAVALIVSFIAPKNAVPQGASTETGNRKVALAGQDIRVTVVSTSAERAKGLGGRTGLAQGEGMLFVFDTDAKYRFWMKDMFFSIDILWLSRKGEVLDMRQNVSPATYPTAFTPSAPARYVLELPAGFAQAYNVKIGDVVSL
ncbi:MAG: DUF192 domain-containing protein [bacterium]|nr:DUF192 domain-containing protein [bacterium]